MNNDADESSKSTGAATIALNNGTGAGACDNLSQVSEESAFEEDDEQREPPEGERGTLKDEIAPTEDPNKKKK